MKKNIAFLSMLFLSFCLLSCGSKPTPASIAQHWCELNGKVHNAKSDSDKDKAKEDRDAYEKSIEDKYKDNTTFMDQVKKETEKCEDASEGR